MSVRSLVLLSTLAVLFTIPARVEARGIVPINTGDDIFEVGPLPEPFASAPESAGWKAGYKCSIFGVFWAYITWWDCQPVAFKDDTYDDTPELAAAVRAQYPKSKMKVGGWKGNGRWLFGILGIAGVVAKLKSKE